MLNNNNTNINSVCISGITNEKLFPNCNGNKFIVQLSAYHYDYCVCVVLQCMTKSCDSYTKKNKKTNKRMCKCFMQINILSFSERIPPFNE